MKGVRTEEAIEIYWKPRFEYDAGVVTVYDFNGDVERRVHCSEIEWGEEWRLGGKIELVDEMVVMSGLEHFDAFINALMRHAVRLLISGYGDDPEEVIEWFSDFGERKFVVEDEYLITGEHGEFADLKNLRILVERSEAGELTGAVAVRESKYNIDLNDSRTFTSFVIATTLA